MTELKQYILSNPRNKLAFCTRVLEGFEFVDIGYELSIAIRDKLHRRNISMLAVDKLQQILNNSQHEHPEYGRYTAIKNIGILFEPELNIDIHSILEQNSKDQLLLICNKTEPFEGIFRLRSTQDSTYSVNLKEFKYIKLYNL